MRLLQNTHLKKPCTSCACTPMYQLCVYPCVPAVGVPPCTSCGCTPVYQLCIYTRVPAVGVSSCTSCVCTHIYELSVYPHVPAVRVPPCTSRACTYVYELCVYPRVPAVCVPTWISWMRTPVHAHISQEQTAGRPLPPSHHITGNFLNFPSHFSTAKSSFNSFVKKFKIQLRETNGPYRKVTPNRKTHSEAAVKSSRGEKDSSLLVWETCDINVYI